MSSARLMSLAIILGQFAISASQAPCMYRNTCQNHTNSMFPPCHCGESCIIYRDCCKEFVLGGSFSHTDNVTLHDADYRCRSLSETETDSGEETGVFMVDNCGQSGMNCNVTDDLLSNMPVSHLNITYRNARCALCNNVSDFTPWKLTFKLSRYHESVLREQMPILTNSTQVVESVLSFDAPYLFYPGDEIVPHFCTTRRVVDQTPHSLYQNMLICNSTLYKNFDACMDDGCCRTDEGLSCYDLQVHDYPVSADNIAKLSELALQFNLFEVHIQLKETVTDYTGNNLQENVKAQFRFSENIFLLELFAADLFANSPFERCSRALLLYLEKMKFGIIPSEANFLTRSEMNNPSSGIKMTLSAIHVKSVAFLDLEEFKEITKINIPVKCSDKESGLQLYGSGRVIERREIMSYFTFSRKDPIERFPFMASEQTLKQKSKSMDCQNVSLAISQIAGLTEVGSECVDEDGKENKDNIIIQESNDGHIQASNRVFLWLCLGLLLFRP